MIKNIIFSVADGGSRFLQNIVRFLVYMLSQLIKGILHDFLQFYNYIFNTSRKSL
jgi:hypothetical protein